MLQQLAGHLREYLTRTSETATQVTNLAACQVTVNTTLENLQDQTSTLHRAVNVLDNRTIHISQSIDNLATATALSQNQIRDLARTEGTLN
jgi:hypothetical protein